MQKWLLRACIWLVVTGSVSAQHSVALLEIPPRPLDVNAILPDNHTLLVPFQLTRGLIWVEATVNNRLGAYILDTGAPGLVLNQDPGDAPTERAHSHQQALEIGVMRVEKLTFGGQSMTQFEAYTLDMSHLSKGGRRVDGLIGYDQLLAYELYLDYHNSQLALLSPGDNTLSRAGRLLQSIPFTLEGHLPVISVNLNGRVVRLGIDTGAAANLLDPRVTRTLPAEAYLILDTETVQGLDQKVQRAERILLEALPVGQVVATDLGFLVTDLAAVRASAGYTIDGLLGYEFLSRYQVSINYRDNKLNFWAPAR